MEATNIHDHYRKHSYTFCVKTCCTMGAPYHVLTALHDSSLDKENLAIL